MLKFKIYKNETFEEENALVNEETKEVVLKGDYYHDKIDSKIEGFFDGLEFCKMDYEIEEEWIDSSHTMFNEIGFYNDEC